MTCPPIFPAQYSIPPASFYNIQGLTNWLNHNKTYKQYFIGKYPYLNPMTSTLSSIKYNVEDVPIAPTVATLSQGQSLMYNQQLALFQKIYTHNSNAYVNYKCTGKSPIYYTYHSYQEKTEYMSAVSLVNKLYPFQYMAEASTLNWQIPFPIYS